jgi:hypothetical protein
MDSKVTTREVTRSQRALRIAALLPPLSLAALAASGCPSRQATLGISQEGVLTLLEACKPCSGPEDGGVDPGCACTLNDHPPPDIENRGLQARLFLITPHDRAVRDSSKCMTLLPCGDAGQPSSCLAERLNQQLDGAIPNGLGFDGLSNPDEVQLILAFYQPIDSGNAASCGRTELVACAGLDPPLGGGIFDISCASCQGGSRSAPGPDNGPCPQPGGVCFLHECEAILQMNGY